MVSRGASSVVVVAALAGLASADPAPKPVDTKAYKDKLIVLKDADGGIYAVVPDKDTEAHVFYGTNGKVLYDQILEGGRSRNGDAWSISLTAPRAEYPYMAQIGRRQDGSFYRSCGQKVSDAELTEITGDKAKEILDKAQFLSTTMLRVPYLFARDDRGVYYYVDVLRKIYGGSGHRVFVGKKGALKQLALTDVTTDSAGDVFATKTGDLRLVRTNDSRDKPTAQWIRGEKKHDLIYLDIYMNQPLIYRDLGLYKTPYTVCGNI